jgi:hypothetical protein
VVTINVPFVVRKRRPQTRPRARWRIGPCPDATDRRTLVKAISRAFRWQKMLETGQFATIKEIAKVEKINASYVSRVLRLTLLAPDFVQALLHGRQNPTMSLHDVMTPFPIEWDRQR